MISSLKDWYRVRPGYWYVPKLYGLGIVPVTVAGWALTFGYVGVMAAAIMWLPSDALRIAAGIPITLGFLMLTWHKTDGAWRWRWGLPAER